MTKLNVIKGDITLSEVDAIVNAANTSLLGGGGVDGAIHRAAGKDLLEECRKLKGCKTGDAKITNGYNLLAKYVIHTVGPVWKGGFFKEEDLLKSCYVRSLQVALENNIKTIAFPCISTGIYCFPKKNAAGIAVNSVKDFINNKDVFEEIIFICFNENNYKIYKDLTDE